MKYEGILVPGEIGRFAEDAFGRKRISFTRKVALRMIVLALCAAGIVALFSFHAAKTEAETTLVAEWKTQIGLRGRYESRRFLLAEQMADRMADSFLAAYANPDAASSDTFSDYFYQPGDGTIRLRPEFYSGDGDGNETRPEGTGVSGFIARDRPPLTPELQRRLILSYETVAKFGPGASAEFANVHVSLPENALIIHWPGVPWGLNAASDLNMTNLSVLRSTLQAYNPERKPVWTGLYFDATAPNWTITYEKPIDRKGRHLITPSVDVSLTDLIGDVVNGGPDGTFDLILSRDGMLVAYPTGFKGLPKDAGQIEITETGHPALKKIYQRLMRTDPSQVDQANVVFDPDLDAYIASSGIDGPDWWLITIHPQAQVEARALRTAASILALIALLFGAFILTAIFVLRTSVSFPIKTMTQATHHLAEGHYGSVAGNDHNLPVCRTDEIGTLARSFQRMADKVEDMRTSLERTVAERTVELELANQQLRDQSRKDALTGALNRRAFDQDLRQAMLDAAQGTAITLALFDVDFFKPFNDHYGHVAGDRALEEVVSEIDAALPGASIYRYGGEEIAAIIPCSATNGARRAVEGAVQAVARAGIPHTMSPFGSLTVSSGAMIIPDDVDDSVEGLRTVLETVDKALYAAKDAGRNRSEWLS
ncbi:GGDEF domain-containing protein [Novosphingobium aquimarinum]|uniref:GGDEF domain-containing protein n=1 Tax=Novosphingobium aquimarinum TaxID=2682494 RepID=UPI0012EC7754|nr:GGDEF domain-containing protein [Novosphingobium aquimarinum]